MIVEVDKDNDETRTGQGKQFEEGQSEGSQGHAGITETWLHLGKHGQCVGQCSGEVWAAKEPLSSHCPWCTV